MLSPEDPTGKRVKTESASQEYLAIGLGQTSANPGSPAAPDDGTIDDSALTAWSARWRDHRAKSSIRGRPSDASPHMTRRVVKDASKPPRGSSRRRPMPALADITAQDGAIVPVQSSELSLVPTRTPPAPTIIDASRINDAYDDPVTGAAARKGCSPRRSEAGAGLLGGAGRGGGIDCYRGLYGGNVDSDSGLGLRSELPGAGPPGTDRGATYCSRNHQSTLSELSKLGNPWRTVGKRRSRKPTPGYNPYPLR